jgi:hypothetical protein
MKRYIQLFKRIVQEDKKLLGRWNILQNEKQIDFKMLQASRDYSHQNINKENEEKDINEEIMMRYMV